MPGLDPEKRKLGQVVLDFVNAKSTDEAAFGFFENIQDVMGYSADFPEKAKKTFPALRPFEALGAPQKKLLRLLFLAQGIVANIQKDNESRVLRFKQIDYEARIYFTKSRYNGFTGIYNPIYEAFSCTLKELKTVLADRSINSDSVEETQLICVFRLISAGDYAPLRSPITLDVGHRFRSISATCYAPFRSAITEHLGHPF